MGKKILVGLACFLLIFNLIGNGLLFWRSNQPQENKVLEIKPSVKRVFPQKTFGDLMRENTEPRIVEALVETPLPRTKTATIALLGDSMIQTMYQVEPLKNLLLASLLTYNFKILNFGVGATSIDSGRERLPQVLSQNPNVVVVESFAYNAGGLTLDHQWEILGKIVEKIKEKGAQPVILSTICPNSTIYAKGIGGLNWNDEQRKQASQTTKSFLENAVKFAKTSNLPLADAYDSSCDSGGEGLSKYIDPASHLHPSALGHELVSQKISEAVSRILP